MEDVAEMETNFSAKKTVKTNVWFLQIEVFNGVLELAIFALRYTFLCSEAASICGQSCKKSVSWYLGCRTFLEKNPEILK